jgi:hypothetical protein
MRWECIEGKMLQTVPNRYMSEPAAMGHSVHLHVDISKIVTRIDYILPLIQSSIGHRHTDIRRGGI